MSALTEREKGKLSDLEIIIEEGLKTFVEVGAALAMIREQRLYRASHDTFEAYCQERWGWTRQRASQLIGAADVVQEVSTIVDSPPANEAQARELTAVPEGKRAEAWQAAVESAPKAEDGTPKVTAAHVKKAAAPYKPMAERRKEAERRPTSEPEADPVPLKQNKDGSIDKLASLRAAREATASEPEPRTEQEWVKAEEKAATEAVKNEPWHRVTRYIERLPLPSKWTDEEVASAAANLPQGALTSARIVHGVLGRIIDAAGKEESDAAA